jgi:hypothetical protein
MFPSITEVLEGVGFDMSHLPQEYSDRGTAIHTYAEHIATSTPRLAIPEKWRGYADAVDSFWDDIKPKPVLVEPELVHDLLGIVGHPDLLEECEYWHDLDDYKTGSVPLYTGAQLMLYKLLIQRNFPHIKHIRRRAVLLKPTGKYQLVPFEDDAKDLATGMEAYHGYMERRGVKWSHR